MNRFLLVLMSFCVVGILASCNKKEDLTTDELLILEIKDSSNKLEVENAEIPTSIKEETDKEYFETYIDVASHVERKGYELTMGSNDLAYFTEDGRRLKWRKKKKGKGCDATIVEVADLPQTIQDYVSLNYPGSVNLGAKKLDDGTYLVGLDTKEVLVFKADGTFVKATDCIHHCGDGKDMGDTIETADLPTTIQTYVGTNYPNAVIRVSFLKDGEYIVVITENNDKIVLGFDANGALLFTK